jgi:hypothetical protein
LALWAAGAIAVVAGGGRKNATGGIYILIIAIICRSVLLLFLCARVRTYAYSCLPLRAGLAAVIINKESSHAVIQDSIASLCFHSLDLAPVIPMAPPQANTSQERASLWPVRPANQS